MIKRTLRYIWGKKFLWLIIALVILLLPNIISNDLQVRTTTVITSMTIDTTQPTIQIEAKKLKPTAGATSIEYDDTTFTGTNIREMLSNVSLAHCTNIDFVGDPDHNILWQLYNYQDLRGNTKINQRYTLDELLKNHDCCYPQSAE